MTGNAMESDLYMEAVLSQNGLLKKYEQSGHIPRVEDPNPYRRNKKGKQYQEWWRSHPREAEQYKDAIRQRNQALHQIYIGYQLHQNRE